MHKIGKETQRNMKIKSDTLPKQFSILTFDLCNEVELHLFKEIGYFGFQL